MTPRAAPPAHPRYPPGPRRDDARRASVGHPGAVTPIGGAAAGAPGRHAGDPGHDRYGPRPAHASGDDTTQECPVNDHTPSQAEGEPEEPDTANRTGTPSPDHPAPSQAEGERDDEPDTGTGAGAGAGTGS